MVKNHQPCLGLFDKSDIQLLSKIMKNSITSISLRGLFMRIFLPLLALLWVSGNSFAANVNLAWDPSASSNVGGYKVSYGTSSGKYTSTVDAGNRTTYSLTGLKKGTKYFFVVKAYDSSKTIESASSNELNVTASNTTVPQSSSGNPSATGGALGSATGSSLDKARAGTTCGALVADNGGLVAAYDFEEGSGKKVVDASGQCNHGIIKGAVRVPNGRYGQALQFDGVKDWVTVNDNPSLDLSTGMTLEAWVRPLSETKGSNTVILKQASKGEVYALYSEEDSGLPASYIKDSEYHGVTGSNRLPTNTWSHLVATYDGNNQRLYVNGVKVAESAQKALIQQSKGKLRIGGNSLWKEYFHGYIDEVRIYNRALSANEVNSNLATAISVSNPSQYVMGNKNLEPWVDYRPEGTAEAFQVTPEKSSIITNVRVYLDASSTAAGLTVGLYKNASGHPGTRIAQGELTSLKAGEWNTIPVSATEVTAGRSYWIAILGSQGQLAFLDQVGSSTSLMETSASNKLETLPYKWKGTDTKANAAMSAYVRGY
ncbi:MAG: LamG-like jellyroll fold domain-containing protein [Methylomicrobium sp.]